MHFIKGVGDTKHKDFYLLNSEFRFPVYRENANHLSMEIEPLKINESIYYIISVISIFKGEYSSITRRELEIISYIKQGCTNSRIASILGISGETVKRHISNMFIKTGAQNRIQLVNKIDPF